MSADALPDELWRKIIETGIHTSGFTYKDLCCLSISSARLHRLSDDESLWSLLFSSDFPRQSTTTTTSTLVKSIYKIRIEKERKKKLLAHKRAVLRKESQIAGHSRMIREIEAKLRDETAKLKATEAKPLNLCRVRQLLFDVVIRSFGQASVALNVWQPEVVRGRLKEIVEQCIVSAESRLHALESFNQLHALQMERTLCNQRIVLFRKVHKEYKQSLDNAKKELRVMKDHPLHKHKSTGGDDDDCNRKRKKLKTCINFSEK